MTAPRGDQAPEQAAPSAPRRLTLLEAENAFTERQTARLAGLREGLFAEMKARIVETDLSVPVSKGPWWYYVRTVEGADYVIHCRLPVGGPERDTTPPSVSEEHLVAGRRLLHEK